MKLMMKHRFSVDKFRDGWRFSVDVRGRMLSWRRAVGSCSKHFQCARAGSESIVHVVQVVTDTNISSAESASGARQIRTTRDSSG